jgi:uncharacterized protein
MKISVKIKLKSKQEKIEKIKENFFQISIKEKPIKGKANEAVINILANYFNVSCSRIKIVSGLKSKEKIIEIK